VVGADRDHLTCMAAPRLDGACMRPGLGEHKDCAWNCVFVVFTPIGLIMRLLGKDLMRRKFDPERNSYRVARIPCLRSHMLNQF
jgi:hypothetical protein